MCKYFHLFITAICSFIKIERSSASAAPKLIYPLRMLLPPLHPLPRQLTPSTAATLQRVRFSIAAAKASDKQCSAITKSTTIAIANCN